MSLARPVYATKYGYRWWDAIRAEWWWRLEHSPLQRLSNFAYMRRKAAERRGVAGGRP